MSASRRIGILTSGGDCAGLNAVIRAVTDNAVRTQGWEVLGIRNSHHGLMARPVNAEMLHPDMGSGDLLRTGGTFLGTTTRGDPTAFPEPDGTTRDRTDEVIEGLSLLNLDGLIVVGGDGSLRLFNQLAPRFEIPWIAVPKTIDNDVAGTDFSVGFYSSVRVVCQALDRLHSTAASHQRVMVLETMGRESGFLALFGGLAGGADAILIPERRFDLDDLIAHISKIRATERPHVLVIVAEGIKPQLGALASHHSSAGFAVAEALEQQGGFDTRCTVLGHTQRGGSPAMFDRLLGTSFGVRAVSLLQDGQSGRMVAWRDGTVQDVAIEQVVGPPKHVAADDLLLHDAQQLGVYVGEPQ